MQTNDTNGWPIIELTFVRYFKNQHFYPANPFSQHLCTLMRRKSFTSEEVAYFRGMGFKVEIKIPEVPEDCLTSTSTTLKRRPSEIRKSKAKVQ